MVEMYTDLIRNVTFLSGAGPLNKLRLLEPDY